MIADVVTYISADAMTNYVINDRTSIDSGWAVAPYYYISVDAVDGLWGADITTESHPLPQAMGEKSGDNFRRGKGITLSGTIYGRGFIEIDAASEYMTEMFWDIYSNRKLKFSIPTLNFSTYLVCRVVNDLAIVRTKQSPTTPNDYRATWTVGLRADDPTIRNWADDTPAYSWMV